MVFIIIIITMYVGLCNVYCNSCERTISNYIELYRTISNYIELYRASVSCLCSQSFVINNNNNNNNNMQVGWRNAGAMEEGSVPRLGCYLSGHFRSVLRPRQQYQACRRSQRRLNKRRLVSIPTLLLTSTSPHSPLRPPECGDSMLWISSLKSAVE